MDNIFFQPWVGKNYKNDNIFSKRIMILGESHHCSRLNNKECKLDECFKKPENCQRFTSDVVNGYLQNKKWERWYITYRKFEQAIYGKKLDDNERNICWNSLLFYNYSQLPMEHPGQRPNNELLTGSKTAFQEVLKAFQPQIIITWGRLVFDTISNDKERTIIHLKNTDLVMDLPTITYDTDNLKCLVFPIYHPSSPRFKPAEWNKVIKNFI